MGATDKNFRIDHPLDPANRYLVHSCVEAPERLNVYGGTVTLDGKGRATVKLPAYHDALNTEHRYQLTPIGGAAPDLHVAAVISKGRFKIAGGTAGLTVCWMVTGVRQDAWAARHKLKVQPLKAKQDRGRYVSAQAFGKPRSAQIGHVAEPRVPRAAKRLRNCGKAVATEDTPRAAPSRHTQAAAARRGRRLSQAGPTRVALLTALIQIAARDEGPDLAVRDAPLEHPEAAIGMDVAHPPRSQHGICPLDAARDRVGGLDLRALDVHDTEAEADLRPEVPEHLRARRVVGGRSPGRYGPRASR